MQAVKSIVQSGEALPKPPVSEPAKPSASEPPKPGETPKSTEAPKDTPKVDENDDVPDNITHAKAEHWNKLKESRNNWRTKASDFEKQITDYQTKLKKFESVNPDELTQKIELTSKERDDLSSRLERVAIEQHPKFQAYFQSRFDQAIESAKAAAGPKADKVLAILEAPQTKWRREEINTLYAEMESEGDKYALAAAIQEYDRTRAEKTKTLENHKEELKKLKLVEAEQETERRKQMAAAQELNYQEALKVADGFEAFKGEDGQTHKTTLQKFVKGEVTKDAYMQAFAKGIDYDRLQKSYATMVKERDELKKAVDAMTAGNPSLRGGSGGAPSGKPTTFAEAVKANMRGT